MPNLSMITSKETIMKNAFFVMGVLALGIGVAAAKENPAQGTIVSENSVQCGTKAKGKGKKTSDLVCQEYVIRTGATDYHVRQEKQEHKELLPINAPVELTMSKDKMKFTVNGKSFEMMIVSEAAAPPAAPAATAATATAAPTSGAATKQ
jgi:hypothetical protein